MKKTLLLSLILLISSIGFSYETPASMMYANSYLQRGTGANSIYWNPANLKLNRDYTWDFVTLDFNINLYNNSISLETYDRINGKFLEEKDKNDLLDDIPNSINISGNYSGVLFATSFKDFGFSSAIHAFGTGKVTEKYFQLLLFGNEYNKEYHFTEANTGFEALAFSDFTIAYQGETLEEYLTFMQHYKIPEINVGFAMSFLAGLGHGKMRDFDGTFIANNDGLKIDQTIVLRNGLGGYGFKGLIGFSSQINDNLSLGLTFDNLLGFINWTGKTEETVIKAWADSVYVSELEEDIFNNSDSTYTIGSYETTFPVEMHLGGLYQFNEKFSLSLDYLQGFGNSIMTTTAPKISFSPEYYVARIFPIRMGFAFGYDDHPYMTTWGLGLHPKWAEFDLSFSSFSAIFPTKSSKGISTAFSVRFKF